MLSDFSKFGLFSNIMKIAGSGLLLLKWKRTFTCQVEDHEKDNNEIMTVLHDENNKISYLIGDDQIVKQPQTEY